MLAMGSVVITLGRGVVLGVGVALNMFSNSVMFCCDSGVVVNPELAPDKLIPPSREARAKGRLKQEEN